MLFLHSIDGGNDRMIEILDRTYKIKQMLRKWDTLSLDEIREVKPLVEDLVQSSLDGICKMQLRWAFDIALDELMDLKIPFAVSIIDFRNLAGLNKYFENAYPDGGSHEKANAVLSEIAQSAILRCAREYKGEAYRIGGDEFAIIFPQMNAEEANSIMKKMQKAVDDIVKKYPDLEKQPHPKHDYLPTGAGGIDYGCADSTESEDKGIIVENADCWLMLSKNKFLDNVVNKQPDPYLWIWDEKNNHYIKNSKKEK